VDLYEEKKTGVLSTRKPLELEDQQVASVNLLEIDQSVASVTTTNIGRIGTFVQGLFFLKNENERAKL